MVQSIFFQAMFPGGPIGSGGEGISAGFGRRDRRRTPRF